MWDFSKVQFTGTSQVSHVNSSVVTEPKGLGAYNFQSNENGYEYFDNITQSVFEEKGYTTKDVLLTYNSCH